MTTLHNFLAELWPLIENLFVLAAAAGGTWLVVATYKLAWKATPWIRKSIPRATCKLRRALRSILPPSRSQGIFKRRSSTPPWDTAPATGDASRRGEFQQDTFTFDWDFPERTVT